MEFACCLCGKPQKDAEADEARPTTGVVCPGCVPRFIKALEKHESEARGYPVKAQDENGELVPRSVH